MAEDDPQTIEVRVKGAATLEGVEQAIRDKMRTDPTELFHNTQTVIFICKKEGDKH
jgi:hypothetical protein